MSHTPNVTVLKVPRKPSSESSPIARSTAKSAQLRTSLEGYVPGAAIADVRCGYVVQRVASHEVSVGAVRKSAYRC